MTIMTMTIIDNDNNDIIVTLAMPTNIERQLMRTGTTLPTNNNKKTNNNNNNNNNKQPNSQQQTINNKQSDKQ